MCKVSANINFSREAKTLHNTKIISSTNQIKEIKRRNAFCHHDSSSIYTFIGDQKLSEPLHTDNYDTMEKQLMHCTPSNLHIIIRPDGHLSTTHCGNNALQTIIAPFNVEYEAATSKLEKSILRNMILDIVYRRGFKFVKQISRNKDIFYEVDERAAWEKIGESLWIERQMTERKSKMKHFR